MRVNTQYILDRLNNFIDGDRSVDKAMASRLVLDLELEIDRLNNVIDALVKYRDVEDGTSWRIDYSTGTPILMYDDCSVIEGQQAFMAMNAIKVKNEK